jgi:hypothetical protein
MSKALIRAQVAFAGSRSRAISALRKENGEANVFAIIIGIVIVALVLGGIAFAMWNAGQSVNNTVGNCVADPRNCS